MAVTDISSLPDTPSPKSASRKGWFSGQGIIEFFVAGGATLLLLPLFFVFAPIGDVNALGLVGISAFWASWVINDPHFTVSYQIFYRDFAAKLGGNGYARGEQVRYWVAGVILPVGLMAWIAGMFAFGSGLMAAGVMQLMFILVGWHYVKQGYGVLSVLSAKRGIFYSPWVSNWVIAHCLLAWLYAWFGFNAYPADWDMSGVAYHSVALGAWPKNLLFWPYVISGVIAAGLLAHKFWVEKRLPPLAAIAGLFVTVELWVVFVHWNAAFAYFIPALHSIQYLFFVFLLERGRARANRCENPNSWPVWAQLSRIAVIALLWGWACFHWLPKFLDGRFGNQEAAYGGLIFAAMFTAFINIHHFAMDNVMWRKGNPDMKYLKN